MLKIEAAIHLDRRFFQVVFYDRSPLHEKDFAMAAILIELFV